MLLLFSRRDVTIVIVITQRQTQAKQSAGFMVLAGLELGVTEGILTSHCSATQRRLATYLVILNHAQVTRTTPEPAPPWHVKITQKSQRNPA
ncbi:hypothetical protein TNCV_835281 [Trichonephila clavipes]|nr:hypothetical protein TNCV_835281 [Trichonephila clavipes]